MIEAVLDFKEAIIEIGAPGQFAIAVIVFTVAVLFRMKSR